MVRYDLSKAFSKVPEEQGKNAWKSISAERTAERSKMENKDAAKKVFKFDFLGIRARGAQKKMERQEAARKAAAEKEEREKQQEENNVKRVKQHEEAVEIAHNRFPTVFGFTMESFGNSRDWERFLVERILRVKAKAFKEACAKQEELMAKLKDDPLLDDAAKEFSDASSVVEKLKKDFWDALNLANTANIPVRNDVDHYVNLYKKQQ